MMTNLLRAIELPEKINVVQTDITDTKELNKIIGSIPKHLLPKKLYLLGDVEKSCEILKENGYKAKILDQLKINNELISRQWNLLKILLYRTVKTFLRKKGFYIHKKNVAYMVEVDEFNGNYLVKKDDRFGYYTHEGFNFKLHSINEHVYLSLVPRIVLTEDKKWGILIEKDNSKFYTYQQSRRYNIATKNLLEFWLEFLSNINGITIPIPNEKNLVFEKKFLDIGETQEVKEKERVTLDDFR